MWRSVAMSWCVLLVPGGVTRAVEWRGYVSNVHCCATWRLMGTWSYEWLIDCDDWDSAVRVSAVFGHLKDSFNIHLYHHNTRFTIRILLISQQWLFFVLIFDMARFDLFSSGLSRRRPENIPSLNIRLGLSWYVIKLTLKAICLPIYSFLRSLFISRIIDQRGAIFLLARENVPSLSKRLEVS